jgi:7,8-dihydroneopterin aldolase/epimerase/oxygenase
LPKIKNMGLIHLNEMEFYAYHGCFEEEQLAGNWFMVDLTLQTNMDKAAQNDAIKDTLNYQAAYMLIKKEMAQKSHLLEHVAQRILNSLFNEFIELEYARVRVSKMNPPMGGKMKSVSVEIDFQREDAKNL